MSNSETQNPAQLITNRYELLKVLNTIKEHIYGQKSHPFTIAQLNYFCHPARNARHYKSFTIPKKSGGVREISAPTRMLKSMLSCVNILLQELYKPSAAAMGFVPGRSILDNARKHQNMNYVFNLDLSNFFPSISQSRVWGALKSKSIGFNEGVASALAGLCCTEMKFQDSEPQCVLPQGSPASPILTNIICTNLDRRLSGLAKRFGANYTRYADDISFSSQHNIYQEDGEFMAELKRIIADQNFRINEKKTRLQKKGARQEVTGLIVSDKVNVCRKYVRSLTSLLYIWKQYGYDSAYGRFLAHRMKEGKSEKTVPAMERVIEGRLLFLKMIKGESDSVYKRLKEQFDALIKTKKQKIADIKYIASFTMAGFERHFNTRINFVPVQLKNDKESYEAVCTIEGKETVLRVSKSCRKKIAACNSEAETENLKKRFYVAFCHSVYSKDNFWLVMNSRPKDVYASTEKRLQSFYDFETNQEDDCEDKSLVCLLEDFIRSDFDLSLLNDSIMEMHGESLIY